MVTFGGDSALAAADEAQVQRASGQRTPDVANRTPRYLPRSTA
jgi:hypothetical protein